MTASQIFILYLFTTTAPRDRRTKCYIRHYHRSWDDQQVLSCSSGCCISTKHPCIMKTSTSRHEETWKTRKKCIFVYRCCQQVYKNLPSLLEDVRNFATGMRCIKTVPPHRKNTQPIYSIFIQHSMKASFIIPVYLHRQCENDVPAGDVRGRRYAKKSIIAHLFL